MDILWSPTLIYFTGEVETMSTRKTSVEINEELLTAVQRVLSTATLKDTIEQAFQEVLKAEARREEVQALATMQGMDLADDEVMAGAWRT